MNDLDLLDLPVRLPRHALTGGWGGDGSMIATLTPRTHEKKTNSQLSSTVAQAAFCFVFSVYKHRRNIRNESGKLFIDFDFMRASVPKV